LTWRQGTLGRALAADTAHHTAAPGATEAALDVRLDAPLPESLTVGAGTALFVCGTCFAPGAPIASLTLLVDGEEQSLMAQGMPRLDLLRASGDPTSYRAGFWGFARIGPRPTDTTLHVGLRAALRDGGEQVAELARIAVAEPLERVAGAPLIAICMAAFEPPLDLFRRQIESIRAQTLTDWVCIVSDDCSEPERHAEMRELLDGDPRFVLSRSDRRRGFYHNFERALELAPAGARYVALADQDDVWDPDKLETLVREIGDAQLVYSDQRIVSPDGKLIADTYWERRRNNHSQMLSLLVANCVTGAASLFRRDLLDAALPLPPAQFTHYHDHWLAVTALALGDIRFVDRTLYGYVQHSDATLGHATATRMPGLRDRLSSLRRGPRDRVRMWRMHYFTDACRLLHFATILQMRCGDRMSARRRRVLERFLRADRSAVPVPGLFARGARELVRRRPETLGAEWVLGYAFGWRRLLGLTTRDRPQQTLRLDALPPLVLTPKPRTRLPGDPDLRAVAEQVAPLPLAVRDSAPVRINLLVPSLEGSPARLHLARRLAERGLRVRVVTVDPVGTARRRELDAVELEFGRESPGLEISRADTFIATNWRAAHIAQHALRSVEADRFLYLIEGYEPLRMPAGTFAALAIESYGFPHAALFSSEMVRDYFRSHRIGTDTSAVFEDAIAAIPAPTTGELERPGPRKLLFHAGPGPYADMFELGILALTRAGELGAFARDWTLHAAGATRSGRRLDLGGGDWMRLLPPGDDPTLLRGHDVGLALMHAPHPGLVPIEMASAGMLTVTNTFETKTAHALAEISPNLIAAEPTVESIAQALRAAADAAGDAERRVLGSDVNWSRDWDESFGDDLLDRVTAFLTA
jgi:hypothetical protein